MLCVRKWTFQHTHTIHIRASRSCDLPCRWKYFNFFFVFVRCVISKSSATKTAWKTSTVGIRILEPTQKKTSIGKSWGEKGSRKIVLVRNSLKSKYHFPYNYVKDSMGLWVSWKSAFLCLHRIDSDLFRADNVELWNTEMRPAISE